MPTDPNVRHEFVLLFDVKNGNPNGDPDAGNLPRVDPETMHGLVTDVAQKRKVRDYVTLTRGEEPPNRIFIQSDQALNAVIKEAQEAEGFEASKNPDDEAQGKVRSKLCNDFFDIRMFGAVLSTGGFNAGQVRGPAQLTFARSVDPIFPMDTSITRIAITKEEDKEKKDTEMGRKPIVPYGLYRAHGYYNPYLGDQTGVTDDDLQLFWEALSNMFEFDRSAARGEMATRGLYIFTHEDKKGNAPAHKLLESLEIVRVDGVETPRAFSDYEVRAPTGLPKGVSGKWWVEP
ncbi:MAG: type I-C CRISPR-associated protein Cas7/Csd2 [Candidatus Thermoplasmatota archaeon]|nr:type I-C CRISPR-associated protein Cas7/Csd2 [Candidatus Thermoplasmatota archaeon]